MGFYIDNRPLYSCGHVVDGQECGARVTLSHLDAGFEPVFVRSCGHDGAKIYANVAARCTGQGGMMAKAEHFVKHTVVGKGLSSLFGRSVVWQ
jgi:hypothetical protein